MENNILNDRPLQVHIIFAESLKGWKNPTTEEGKAMLLKHYAWAAELKANGKLILAGPANVEIISARDTNPSGIISGIIMLNVASKEEAEELAFKDPFHMTGFRKNEVHSMKITITDNSVFEQLKQIIK